MRSLGSQNIDFSEGNIRPVALLGLPKFLKRLTRRAIGTRHLDEIHGLHSLSITYATVPFGRHVCDREEAHRDIPGRIWRYFSLWYVAASTILHLPARYRLVSGG